MIDIVLAGAIRSGTSVLYTCLGEVVAEKSGVVNLGAEGCMLVGALTAFAVTAETGNPYIGVLAGGIAGALLALLHAFMVIERAANQLASGLTIMILAQGITAFFGRGYVGRQITGLNPIYIPGLSDLPYVGPVLFQHDVLTYVAVTATVVVWFFLARTKWGLVLRATGERDEVTYACGYSPSAIRYGAVLLGGFLAGVGGAQLAVAYTLNWVENMTQGRGLVAVALVIFAGWSPLRSILASFLFGGAVSLQLVLQAQGVPVSPFLLSMAPYLLTLVVLVLVGQRRTFAMPEGLRAVFTGSGGALQTNR
jgi:general nucleoside transport system permease protein